MSKPLRLGFIGGGLNSAVGRAHYAACRMDGKFEVVAGFFSRDKEVNSETADAFNCVATGPSRTRDDAVVVLTPTPDHFETVSSLLRYGFPVICEKALASTSEESAALIKLRDETNGFLAVTYNYTGYPMVREMRDMILSGSLGKIVSVQAEMPQEGYLRERATPQVWRKHDGAIPSVHLDLGTHLHHLIHYVTGDTPTSLVAHQQSRGQFLVVDDVQCIAEYSKGFVASLWFGKVALGHRNGLRIRVNMTHASLEWTQSNPEEIVCAYADGRRMTLDRGAYCEVANAERYQRFKAGHPAGFIEAYANLYSDFADLLNMSKGEPAKGMTNKLLNINWKTPYSAEIAHDGLVMMEAMVKSAKEKQWITL